MFLSSLLVLPFFFFVIIANVSVIGHVPFLSLFSRVFFVCLNLGFSLFFFSRFLLVPNFSLW
jgi:low affinity Fe/Cu permease